MLTHAGETSNCKMLYVASSKYFKQADNVPGRLALLAKRDIEEGEFLSYDYKESSEALEEGGYALRELVECKCNDKFCKKWVL
jgi:SET domain-containing protein